MAPHESGDAPVRWLAGSFRLAALPDGSATTERPPRTTHETGMCQAHAARHGETAGRGRNIRNARAQEGSIMVVRIVRLGSARSADEGTRIGTVRRPPRGVPKAEFASRNFYDVWFPNLAPSLQTMKMAQEATTPAQWAAFVRKYRAEMAEPEHAHAIGLLARLSHQTNFAVGCYCEDEAHCHRSVLRELLLAQGADVAAS